MRKIIFIIIFISILIIPIYSAPFKDLPHSHWAKDAVLQLQQKGLINGINPDLFYGNRPTTRYQMAIIIKSIYDRLSNSQEKIPNFNNYITKSDLKLLKKLTREYKNELNNLGKNENLLENQITNLENKISKLEKIRFSGKIETIYAFSNIIPLKSAGPSPYIGGNPNPNRNSLWLGGQNPVGEDYTFAAYKPKRVYFPSVYNMNTLTTAGNLDIETKIDENYSAKISLGIYQSATTNGGNIGYTYAPTASYFVNPQNLNYNFADTTDLSLDSFTLKNNKKNISITIGAFYPEIVPDFVYKGMPNISFFGKDFLQSYGIDIFKKAKNYSYEAYLIRIPNVSASNTINNAGALSGNYSSHLFGFTYQYKTKNLKINANLTKIEDPSNSGFPGIVLHNDNKYNLPIVGPSQNPAHWTYAVNGWDNSGNPFIGNLGVGPQKEFIYSLALDYKFSKHIKASLKYAHSNYKPNSNYSYSIDGSLIDFKINANYQRYKIFAQYINISPFYDPYIARIYNFYNIVEPVSNPVRANFSIYEKPAVVFPSYYLMHHEKLWTQNREGFKFGFTYKINKKYKIFAKYIDVSQVKPSIGFYSETTFNNQYANIVGMQPGFYDVLFKVKNYYQNLPKGRIQNLTLGFNINFSKDLSFLFKTTSTLKYRRIGDLDSGWLYKYNNGTNRWQKIYHTPGTTVSRDDKAQNNTDFRAEFTIAALNYKLNKKTKVRLDYIKFRKWGDINQPSDPNRGLVNKVNPPDNLKFCQQSYSLRLDYKLNKKINYFIWYRHIIMDDQADRNGPSNPGEGPQSDWKANQIITGISYKF